MSTYRPEDPEIPFSLEWGRQVREARIAAKLTQRDLGKLVGTSQGEISLIEKQEVPRKRKSTKYALGICRALPGLLPPTNLVQDAIDLQWIMTGRALREVLPQVFRALLISAMQSVEETQGAPSTGSHKDEHPPSRPRR